MWSELEVDRGLRAPVFWYDPTPSYYATAGDARIRKRGFDIIEVKRYPAYKDSGVPWLGDVPAHWSQLPGRACFREVKTPNTGLVETTVLSLSYGRIVVRNPESLHGLVPASFETYQIVEPGEIIVRPTDLQNDWNSLRFAICRNRGIITSAYLCFRTRAALTPGYGHLLLHSYDLMKVFYGLGSGLRQNLDWEDFKYLPCLVPPLPEQTAIVRFLAHTDRQVNRLIRAKRRLIELLNEEKQAIIHRAVTRGLDPTARLKPSGVEWLGDVPAHWEVNPIKAEMTCLNRRRVPMSGVERDKMTVRAYDYYGASGVIDRVANYIFDGELILIAEDGANLLLRNLPLAIIARGKFWVNNHAHVLEPRDGNLEYLASVLECIDYNTWISGAAQPKLTKDRLMAVRIPVPPVREQDLIMAQIHSETSELTLTVELARREIALLREYRTRLIADVVTGKLDVREAAASLPDEDQGPEPPDEGGGIMDTEEDVVDEFDALPEEEDV